MHNGIFEGGFRRLPEQNLAGASKHTRSRKVEFLQQLQQDRLNRKNDIKKNECAIKIQALIRGFISRSIFKKERRKEFDLKFTLFKNKDVTSDELTLFLIDLLIFYNPTLDDSRLHWVTLHIIRLHNELMSYVVSQKLWVWRIERLLLCNLRKLQISSNRDVAVPIQLLDVFTSPERIVSILGVEGSKIYLNQVISYLVRNGYFQVLRSILNDVNPNVCNEVNVHTVVQLIDRTINLINPASVPYIGDIVVEYLCKEIVCKHITANVKRYLLPLLTVKGEWLFLILIDTFLEKRFPPTLSFFYSILQFCINGNFTLDTPFRETTFIKCMDIFSFLWSNLSKYVSHLNQGKYFPVEETQDNDDDDEDMETGTTVVNEELNQGDIELLEECFDFLISPELAGYILNSVKTANKSMVILPLSKFLHHLIMSHPLAMTKIKVLNFISFQPSLHKEMWDTLLSLKRNVSTGQSYILMYIVAKGHLLKTEESRVFYPLLTTFCATFKNLLTTLHNEEVLRIEDSEDKMMPFSIGELIDMCVKLRDVALGLLQIAYPETQIICAPKQESFSKSQIEDCNVLYLLLKEVVGLLRLLHTRDLGSSSNRSFWVSEKIIAPRNVPFHQMDNILRLNKPFITTSPVVYGEDKKISSVLISYMFILQEIPFCVSVEKRIIFLQNLIQQSKFEFQNPNLHFLQSQNVFVNIRRDYLYEDSFEKLSLEEVAEIRLAVRVQLTSAMGYEEPGIDGGGIFREFMFEFMKAAFDPNRGFFLLNRNNQLYPNPHVQLLYPDYKQHYFFIGRMLGKALYENMLVELPLAEFFVAKLVGTDMDLSSLDSLDTELFKNLVSLRSYEGDFGDLGLNFTIVSNEFGETKVIELKKNGEETAVTKMNRLEYIFLVADYKLNKQIKSQCAAIKQGIASVIPLHWLSMFSSKELQVIISGADCPIDVDDLSDRTVYTGGYSVSHPNIIMFWNVVRSFSDVERRLLLKFVTSCSRPPLLGFKDLDPPFTIQLVESSDRLPTSSTCTNLLKLPLFPDKNIMREKILYSIQAGAGFELC